MNLSTAIKEKTFKDKNIKSLLTVKAKSRNRIMYGHQTRLSERKKQVWWALGRLNLSCLLCQRVRSQLNLGDKNILFCKPKRTPAYRRMLRGRQDTESNELLRAVQPVAIEGS